MPKQKQTPARTLKTQRPKTKQPAATQAAALKNTGLGGSSAASGMLASVAGTSDEPFRLPDSILEESVPLVLVDEFQVSSDAAGYCAFSIDPTLIYSRVAYTVTAGATGVGAPASHPDRVTYAAAFPYARMLMYRVTVQYVGAEQTASGRFYAINSSGTEALQSKVLADIYDDANYTGRAIDGFYDTILFTQPPRYETPDAVLFMKPTFQSRNCFAAGLPFSTPVYRVRIERFMEGLPGRDSLHRGSAQVEFYNSGMMEVLTNASHPGLHGGAFAKKDQIVANVWKGIKAGAGFAWQNRSNIGRIASTFAGPSAKLLMLGG